MEKLGYGMAYLASSFAKFSALWDEQPRGLRASDEFCFVSLIFFKRTR